MASRSWNRVELIGNLTRDPELRYTPNGAAVCTFGLATNYTYVTSDGEKKEEVDFHRIVAWNKLAEICNQFLKKGTRVFSSGRLRYREWEPQEGLKRRDVEIVMEDMIILSPRVNGEPVITSDMAPTKPDLASAGPTADHSDVSEEPTEKVGSKKKESSKKEEVDEKDLPF